MKVRIIKEPQTAIMFVPSFFALFNKYIKEFEVKEDEVKTEEENIKSNEEDNDFIGFVESHGFQHAGSYRERYVRLKNKRSINKEVCMKIIKVSSCGQCPDHIIDNYLGKMMCGRKGFPIDVDLPSWCPLEEEIETDMKNKEEIIARDKEVCMKKAVFILQPTIQNGVDGYIVKGWENVLQYKELPEEYFKGYPIFYYVVIDYEITNKNKIVITGSPCSYLIDLYKDMFFDKKYWSEILEILQQAGHRLSQILEEQRKPEVIRVEI